MKYNLALDSGGTKVLAILYDEDFVPVRTCRVGSVRGNTSTNEQIENNINELIEKLDLHGAELSHIGGTMESYLWKKATSDCMVEDVKFYGELQLGLAAACIFGDGYLGLSGTGVGLIARLGDKQIGVGGYGAAVSDDGSGYWIGREAVGAAIRDDECRGERTVLTDLIAQKLGGTRDSFRETMFSIYGKEKSSVSPVTWVASFAPLVSQAAYDGDVVATDILKRTGTVLAEQLTAMIRKNNLPKDLPITVSGSVWKGHPIIFDEFSRLLREFGMKYDAVKPDFEPIVGSIICHYYEKYGKFNDDDRERFKILYKDYLFK